jgi:hypothetical protein
MEINLICLSVGNIDRDKLAKVDQEVLNSSMWSNDSYQLFPDNDVSDFPDPDFSR